MDTIEKVLIGLVAAFIAFAVGMLFISAHFESKTYNRLTGAKTTTWDALWVELRVQDAPKDK